MYFPAKRKAFPCGNERNTKTTAGLNYPIVLSEAFIAVVDDNVCTAPIMADKDILEFVQNSKNIVDADSKDEHEMNNAAPVFPRHPK
ncbi:hypothetical protein TNCV_3831091 [Trichonephila clavipes]|nr:hypothetical protein TNCV_3831091 [Trichonephila clavipes]